MPHGTRPIARAAAGLAASAVIGAAAYRRGSLSRGGVAGAMLTGTTIFAAGGALPSALLLTFFTSSTLLSHWRSERKRDVAVEAAKGERRDLAQTLANGGTAAVLALVGWLRPASPWLPALAGALATANADTWATEIGLLSHRRPRHLLTGRIVAPGTSGGVTPVGLGAAALGAATIGAVAAAGIRLRDRPRVVHLLPLTIAAGVAGCLVDSLLGATVQARYHCPTCDVATERVRHRCGAATALVGGWRLVDNDVVNFLASLCGALIGWRGGR